MIAYGIDKAGVKRAIEHWHVISKILLGDGIKIALPREKKVEINPR